MKIDFKNHKKETRNYLLTQYKKQIKKELIENLIFGFAIIIIFGLLFLYIIKNKNSTNDFMNNTSIFERRWLIWSKKNMI